MRFRDRREAGTLLAAALGSLREERPIVLALPRGGVPVAAEIARALGAPLDVIVVRKLGVPRQPELGMGAIGEGGARVLNDDVIRLAGVGPGEIAAVEARERAELERRARRFRGGRPMLDLEHRTVIVVDDGLATGGTARAALQVARAHRAGRIVLAVPVAPVDTLRDLAADADDVVCLETPPNFFGVGQWYENFTQVTDDEVADLLAAAAELSGPAQAGVGAACTEPRDEEVVVRAGSVTVSGHLTVPSDARGIVVFAHGSGSSRHSARNQYVAGVLNDAGFGTLLFDLLTTDEERDRSNVFDIDLLASRLRAATAWVAAQPSLAPLPVGYFGASTGAGAALRAAADPSSEVRAVVSRGGRVDLAGNDLPAVRAATLMIVGGCDDVVLDLNREAARRMRCTHQIVVIPGATHLFEEPGALPQAAQLACRWFDLHLAAPA
jgi:putative phosphoribosyl transferase